MVGGPKLSWHAFDLRSGRRLQALATREQGTIGRIIGEATEATVNVRCYDPTRESAPEGPSTAGQIPGVRAATLPGRIMLAALDETDSEKPLYGGIVLRRTNATSGGQGAEWYECYLATLEHYLGRRYCADLSYDDTDQATIAAGVMDGIAVDGLDFTIDAPATGILRDLDVKDADDKTALAVLTELLEADRGLDFTVDLEWTDDDHLQLHRILRFRERLGISPAIPTTFTLPGSVVDYVVVEDYSEGYGANDVVATSSGSGELRPQSVHQQISTAIANGWARFEYRYSAGENIKRIATLNSAARRRARVMADGITQTTITSQLDNGPRVGVDFALGDDIRVELTSAGFPALVDANGQLQPGFAVTERCVGWEIDADARTLKPTTIGGL